MNIMLTSAGRRSYMTKGIPPKYADKEGANTIWVLNQKCNRNFEISYAEARLQWGR